METTQTTSPSSQSVAKINLVSKWHQIPSRKKTLIVISVILILVIAGAIIYAVIVINQKNKQLQLQYQAYQKQQMQALITQMQSVKSQPITQAEIKGIVTSMQKNSATISSADIKAMEQQLQQGDAANYQAWKNAQTPSAQ